jgi:hypothetical protein
MHAMGAFIYQNLFKITAHAANAGTAAPGGPKSRTLPVRMRYQQGLIHRPEHACVTPKDPKPARQKEKGRAPRMCSARPCSGRPDKSG